MELTIPAGKNQYTTVGSFDLQVETDGRIRNVKWDDEENVEILRQRYKVFVFSGLLEVDSC